MNRANLVGNLTRDPELRQTQKGESVCTFPIAVNRRGDGVDYLDITVWRGQAENCYRYLKKGRKVAVAGRIETSVYEDKNGAKRTSWRIIADEVEFLTARVQEEAPADFDDMPY